MHVMMLELMGGEGSWIPPISKEVEADGREK